MEVSKKNASVVLQEDILGLFWRGFDVISGGGSRLKIIFKIVFPCKSAAGNEYGQDAKRPYPLYRLIPERTLACLFKLPGEGRFGRGKTRSDA